MSNERALVSDSNAFQRIVIRCSACQGEIATYQPKHRQYLSRLPDYGPRMCGMCLSRRFPMVKVLYGLRF